MNSDARSDAEVLEAARAGEPRSFAVLFDRHRDRVFGHALRLTRIRADAEDVTAVTFLEAWRNQDRIRIVEGSVLPWLLVTATNTARNLARASRRYRAALDALTRTAEPDEPTGSSAALQEALQGLNVVDQQLLALTLEGFSTAEAAVALGLSAGAARTRLSRARRRLRDRLRPEHLSAALPEGSS